MGLHQYTLFIHPGIDSSLRREFDGLADLHILGVTHCVVLYSFSLLAFPIHLWLDTEASATPASGPECIQRRFMNITWREFDGLRPTSLQLDVAYSGCCARSFRFPSGWGHHSMIYHEFITGGCRPPRVAHDESHCV